MFPIYNKWTRWEVFYLEVGTKSNDVIRIKSLVGAALPPPPPAYHPRVEKKRSFNRQI